VRTFQARAECHQTEIAVCGAQIYYAVALAIFCHAEKVPPHRYISITSLFLREDHLIRLLSLMLVGVCAVLGLAVAGPARPSNIGARPDLNDHVLHTQLQRLSQTLQATHTAKILVIGSSSTVGVGATSASKTYVARLEPSLESAITGMDFEVVGRGISGEVAQGAADRMLREVEDVKPDLVIWQVGTNDALGHIAIDRFRACLQKTLSWLKAQNVDVMLINPQYGQSLVKDTFYGEVVKTISEVALEARVPIVDRFGAMRRLELESHLSAVLSADNLHMNDEGYRRLAEQLTAEIVSGLPKGGVAAGAATVASGAR
jgi:acyl-CoA thioesterase I